MAASGRFIIITRRLINLIQGDLVRGIMEVKVINNQIESALQKLKRQLIREGLFKDLKRRRYYSKPSVRAKLKREEAEKARHKDRKRAVARDKNIL